MCSSINKNLLKINKKIRGRKQAKDKRQFTEREVQRVFKHKKGSHKQRQMEETVRCQFSTDQVGKMENSDREELSDASANRPAMKEIQQHPSTSCIYCIYLLLGCAWS